MNEVESKLNLIVSRSLEAFGAEIFKLLDGPNIFKHDEIHLFLYN